MSEHDAPPGVRYEAGTHAIWLAGADPSDEAHRDALYDAFVRARLDDTRSVVVLRLRGVDDPATIRPTPARHDAEDPAAARYREEARRSTLLEAIEACPHTTIAVLEGRARADALGLALVCDLAIASRDAALCFDAGAWGRSDGPGSVRLPRRIGLSRAKELLFTAREIDAEEALAIGLVNRVCAAADLDDATAAFVADVLTASPGARRAMKDIAGRELPSLSDTDAHPEAGRADADEGLAAVREGRSPAWRHRGDPASLLPSPTSFD